MTWGNREKIWKDGQPFQPRWLVYLSKSLKYNVQFVVSGNFRALLDHLFLRVEIFFCLFIISHFPSFVIFRIRTCIFIIIHLHTSYFPHVYYCILLIYIHHILHWSHDCDVPSYPFPPCIPRASSRGLDSSAPGCRPQQLDAWPGDDVNSVGAAFLESWPTMGMWQCVKTNSTPVVHIKIAGLKWMCIPLKMGIFIGIDPYPCGDLVTPKKMEGVDQLKQWG